VSGACRARGVALGDVWNGGSGGKVGECESRGANDSNIQAPCCVAGCALPLLSLAFTRARESETDT
jgi:hypothetical protein